MSFPFVGLVSVHFITKRGQRWQYLPGIFRPDLLSEIAQEPVEQEYWALELLRLVEHKVSIVGYQCLNRHNVSCIHCAAITLARRIQVIEVKQNLQEVKRGPGRPAVWNPDLEAKLFEGIEAGISLEGACDRVGISYSTFNNRRNADAAFNERVRLAISQAEWELVNIIKSGAAKDWKAAAWMLEKRLPKTYGKKEEHQHLHAHAAVSEEILAKLIGIRADRDRQLTDGRASDSTEVIDVQEVKE